MSGGNVIPSLARVVRGLTLLFWAVPGVLLADTATALDFTWRQFGYAPPLVAAGTLVYGLLPLRQFQSRERVWRGALDRALLLGLVLLALAPTPVWWNRAPEEAYFAQGMLALVFGGLAFLVALNDVLRRLAAMLPDETLRAETRFFTALNTGLLTILAAGVGAWLGLHHWPHPPDSLAYLRSLFDLTRPWLLIMATLLPVALTMTLLWKTKEVILHSAFGE
jgi:hypothetical protein